MSMAYRHTDGIWRTLCSFRGSDLGYDSSVLRIYEECERLSKLYEVSLGEFTLCTSTEYDSEYWYVEYYRPSTPEEIKAKQKQDAGIIENRRRQYEQLKKEFEKNV